MSIQVYSIRLKKFYWILLALTPLWMAITVLFQLLIGGQVIAVIVGLLLLTVTALLAQNIARKQIDLTIENNTLSFDETSIAVENLLHIKIDKTGVGTSSIEFHLKTEGKSVLTLTNLKDNANKAIAFVETSLPEVEFIGPEDLLG